MNYITHRAANCLNLRCEYIMLVVHGVGGPRENQVIMKIIKIIIKSCVSTPKSTLRVHQLVCCGLHNRTDIQKSMTLKQLQLFFPDVRLDELVRPKELAMVARRQHWCRLRAQMWRLQLHKLPAWGQKNDPCRGKGT